MKTLNPNDFGKTFLVEECRKIRIDDLLKACRTKLKKLVLGMELVGLGVKIDLTTSKTPFNGTRFWFACPVCGKKAGVLFQHPLTDQIGCRTCFGLEYAKRRYKGMIEENYNR